MANAFRDILGFVGNTADAVLLGGTVGASRRRNQFADYLDQGQFDQAEQLAVRNGEGAYAQLAQQRGQQKTLDERTFTRGALTQIRALPVEARPIAFQALTPFAREFGFDDQDLQEVAGILGDDNALDALLGGIGGGAADQETFGVAPQFIRQPDGSVRAVQFGNRGTIRAQDAGGVPLPIEQRFIGLDQGQQRINQAYELASPDLKGQQAQATAIGKASGEISAEDLPRSGREARAAENRVAGRSQRIQLVSDTIDRAIEQSKGSNTGPIAGRNPFATNLQSTIDTIAANIGFEELQRLRDNSPTGGALGQVSERENVLLQSVLGSLSRAQSEKQFDENLRRAKREIIASWDRVAAAYEQDYGRPYKGAEPSSQESRNISDYTDEELEAIANGGR